MINVSTTSQKPSRRTHLKMAGYPPKEPIFTPQTQELEPQNETPSKENLQHRLQVAVHAALSAGQIITRYFNQKEINIMFKPGMELVTDADKESDATIQEIIKEEYPTDRFLTEETYNPKETVPLDSTWIIDPIDGTSNFASKIPHFAVSIAYVKDGKPKIGVIYDPIKKELFTTIKGGGVFLNGEPVHTNHKNDLQGAMVSHGFWVPERLFKTGAALRQFGSYALDQAYVACGRLSAALNFSACPWDIAASAMMVQNAGGQVTDVNGATLDLNQEYIDLVSSNGRVHKELLGIHQEQPSSFFRVYSTIRNKFLTLWRKN